MNIQIQLDDAFLDAYADKTGQSKEMLVTRLGQIAQKHLMNLIGQTDPGVIPLDAFKQAGREVSKANEPLFRELAK